MTIMTAPPSQKAQIVDVGFLHNDLAARLSAGGRNIDAQVAGGEIYGTNNRPAEWYARLRVKF